MTLSHLTLSDLEGSNSRSLTFQSLISCKGAELGHMLLLTIDRKAYKETPMASSHLTLSDLQRSNSRSFTFCSLIYHKGAELGHMLLLNINRKAYMGSPMTLSHMTLSDLERSKSGSLKSESLYSITCLDRRLPRETTGLEGPPAFGRKTYISVEMNLSPKTTCLERPHFCGQSGGLSRQVSRKGAELLNINHVLIGNHIWGVQ